MNFDQLKYLAKKKKIKERKRINSTLMAGHNSFFGYMAGNTDSFNIMHMHKHFKLGSAIFPERISHEVIANHCLAN